MKNVTAIITTTGRESLTRAIASVRNQSVEVAEIIVVSHEYLELDDVTVLTNPVPRNVCSSRNLGLLNVTSPYVAFLDDDDFWLPEKIETQLLKIPMDSDNFLISCASIIKSEYGKMVQPRTIMNIDEEVRQYLFGSYSIYPGDRFMQTSSILLHTEIAKKLLWDERLPRHNDWDFLIRANDLGLTFYMVESALVVVDQTEKNSISRSKNFELSQSFITKHFENFTELQKSNFMIDVQLQTMINGKAYLRAFNICWKALCMYPSFGTKLLGGLKITLRLINARILVRKFQSAKASLRFQKFPHSQNFTSKS